ESSRALAEAGGLFHGETDDLGAALRAICELLCRRGGTYASLHIFDGFPGNPRGVVYHCQDGSLRPTIDELWDSAHLTDEDATLRPVISKGHPVLMSRELLSAMSEPNAVRWRDALEIESCVVVPI